MRRMRPFGPGKGPARDALENAYRHLISDGVAGANRSVRCVGHIFPVYRRAPLRRRFEHERRTREKAGADQKVAENSGRSGPTPARFIPSPFHAKAISPSRDTAMTPPLPPCRASSLIRSEEHTSELQ